METKKTKKISGKQTGLGSGVRVLRIVVAAMALLLLPGHIMADEAWVEYDASNTTLTFKYGTKPSSFGDNVTAYALNAAGTDPGWLEQAASVTSVVFDPTFASARPTTCEKWFKGMESLGSITGISYLKTDEVTSMNSMFYKCLVLPKVDVTGFNTAKVTDMEGMFFCCNSLTSLDVSNFNTAKVTNMEDMFDYCYALTSLDVSNFNTSEVTTMRAMFCKCRSMTKLNVSGLNTGKVTDMSLMFYDLPVENLDVSSFNTANVTSMRYMFSGCKAKTLDLSNFNTENVTDMSFMFYVSGTLEHVDLSSFNTANVTNMRAMFGSCTALASVSLLNFNTAKVTTTKEMFAGCTGMVSLNLLSFNTAAVTDMEKMFSGCTSLTKIYVHAGFTTDNVKKSTGMFSNCTSLSGAVSYDAEKTDVSMANTSTGYFTDGVWVEYDASTKTLTFKCGEKPSTFGDNVTAYGLNKSGTPGWNGQAKSVTSVVIDPTFASARPTTCEEWFSDMTSLSSITGLSYLNTEEVTSMRQMFYYCMYVPELDLSNFNTEKVTNMSQMFQVCASLKSIDVKGFNTSKVTDMSNMFSACRSLQALDLSSFNTANVTDMNNMFDQCIVIQSLNCKSFNTEKVKNMSRMFGYCSLQTLDLSNFNTANVTDMSKMFWNCKVLTSLDLSSFNTANVTKMGDMFYNCQKLEALDLSNFNTANVTKMGDMFNNCKVLTSLDLSSFNTANVTDMGDMFNGCEALESLDLSSFNTEKVTDMASMFSKCYKLEYLDLSPFNTANVTKMDYMFNNCTNLKAIYVCKGFTTGSVTESTNMFNGCTSLSGAVPYDAEKIDVAMANTSTGYLTGGAWVEYNKTTMALTFWCNGEITASSDDIEVFYLTGGTTEPQWKDYASDMESVVFDASFAKMRPSSCYKWFSDMISLKSITGLEYLNTEAVLNMSCMFKSCSVTELDMSKFNTAKVTDMSYMFSGCKAKTLDLSNFNTENVTNMSYMFNSCSELTSLDVSSFNTTNVTDMNHMFYNGKGLSSLKLSSFNTANVTNMSYMFYYCNKLTALDLSSFNTANVANMYYMFANCTGLTKLDLSGFNTAKVTNMGCMFSNCSGLTTLDLASFRTPAVTSMIYMFRDCSSLVSLNLSSLNTANVTVMSSMFSGCSSLALLDLASFNTANVTNMTNMFEKCSSLKTIYVSDKFTVAQIASTRILFTDCTALEGAVAYDANKVDASMANYTTGYFTKKTAKALAEYNSSTKTLTFKYGYENFYPSNTTSYEIKDELSDPKWMGDAIMYVVFDPSFASVRPTSCYKWFYGQTELTRVDGTKNFCTDDVTNMAGMFAGCSDFFLPNFTTFNTKNVTTMASMFQNCSSLNELDVSSFNTEKVTDMSSMFAGCSDLEELNLCKFNTKSLETATSMFSGCSSLKAIYVSEHFVTTSVTAGADMFAGCTSLAGAVEFDSGKTGVAMANYTNGYLKIDAAWAEFDSETQTLTFKYGLVKPSSTETVRVYSLNDETHDPGWIACRVLKAVFEPSFASVRPTSCFRWFHCLYDLASVEGLENLCTDSVTTMAGMFHSCYELKELDLTHFNTEKVTSMETMFYMCTSLTTIYVSDKFVTTAVTNGIEMLNRCSKLVGAANYNSNKVDLDMANYKTGYFKTYYQTGEEKHELCGEELSVDNLELTDGEDFVAMAPFSATSATYTRSNMTSNWATLCLPFEMDADNVDGCKFYELASVDDDRSTITLNNVTGTIAAGTPVLACFDTSAKSTMSIDASSVDVVKEPAAGNQCDGWTLVGSFAETEVPDNGYIISKNKFWLTADLKDSSKGGATAVKTKAMRAWLNPNGSSAAKAFSLNIANDDEPTAVDAINALTEGKAEFYDPQGRRTSGLQKGLNIIRVNGKTKKVMVK